MVVASNITVAHSVKLFRILFGADEALLACPSSLGFVLWAISRYIHVYIYMYTYGVLHRGHMLGSLNDLEVQG